MGISFPGKKNPAGVKRKKEKEADRRKRKGTFIDYTSTKEERKFYREIGDDSDDDLGKESGIVQWWNGFYFIVRLFLFCPF